MKHCDRDQLQLAVLFIDLTISLESMTPWATTKATSC